MLQVQLFTERVSVRSYTLHRFDYQPPVPPVFAPLAASLAATWVLINSAFNLSRFCIACCPFCLFLKAASSPALLASSCILSKACM